MQQTEEVHKASPLTLRTHKPAKRGALSERGTLSKRGAAAGQWGGGAQPDRQHLVLGEQMQFWLQIEAPLRRDTRDHAVGALHEPREGHTAVVLVAHPSKRLEVEGRVAVALFRRQLTCGAKAR